MLLCFLNLSGFTDVEHDVLDSILKKDRQSLLESLFVVENSPLPINSKTLSIFNQYYDGLHVMEDIWESEDLPRFGFTKGESNIVILTNNTFNKLSKNLVEETGNTFPAEKIINVSIFSQGSSIASQHTLTKSNIIGFSLVSYILNGRGVYSHRTYIRNQTNGKFEEYSPYTKILNGYTGCEEAPLLSVRIAQELNLDTYKVSSHYFAPRKINKKHLNGRVTLDSTLAHELIVANFAGADPQRVKFSQDSKVLPQDEKNVEPMIQENNQMLISLEPAGNCGNSKACRAGSTSCNILKGGECASDEGWAKAQVKTENTIAETHFTPKSQNTMYNFRDSLLNTPAEQYVTMAYQHWEHMRFDLDTLQLYTNFLDIAMTKLNLITQRVQSDEVVVTEELFAAYMDIVTMYHAPEFSNSKFNTLRADLITVANKLRELKGMTATQVNTQFLCRACS